MQYLSCWVVRELEVKREGEKEIHKIEKYWEGGGVKKRWKYLINVAPTERIALA